MDSKGARRGYVVNLVIGEIYRTEDNLDDPSVADYIADVVRYLSRFLPEGDPFRELADDGVNGTEGVSDDEGQC